MYEQSIGPCKYPGCRDTDGNPRLTRDTICEASRRHYRAILDRIAQHYAHIHATMPAPVPPPGERVMRLVAKEYGHPAEWASDICRETADFLNGAHDELAEHLHHAPPPHPGTREVGRVVAAHHYLTAWFDDLCTFPGAEGNAAALHDLERRMRSGLGKTDPRRFLPVPCPKCDILGLVRELNPETGEDRVDCHACWESIPQQLYAHWTRVLLDELIEKEDQQNEDATHGAA